MTTYKKRLCKKCRRALTLGINFECNNLAKETYIQIGYSRRFIGLKE